MRSLCLWVVMAGVGCGGNVVVDGGNGGTGTGTGASTSTGTSTGTSASTSTSASTGTTSGSTGTTTVTTGTEVCPVPFPGIEAACAVEGQVCPVPESCCGGGAECINGVWTWGGVTCGQPCSLPCGPNNFSCAGGAVCVAYIGTTTTYQCEADICSPASLTCSCAEALCATEGMVCNNVQMGFKVLCD